MGGALWRQLRASKGILTVAGAPSLGMQLHRLAAQPKESEDPAAVQAPFGPLCNLATAAVTNSGGWHEQEQQQQQVQQLSAFHSLPRRPAAPTATSPRSPLPLSILEQQPAPQDMSHREGSISGSSHGSLGELAPSEAELSELEQRKVVVLGVPWQTDDAALHQHFSQFGVVEEAQIMREKYTGKSRGFGFVTFRATTDALKAVNAEHTIDGRKCETKFALPEGKVGSARTTRIFVARIPSSVSDAQFRQYFEQFGVCQDCYMPKDPSKQGHRGIGFVTYSSPESVELVMGQTHVLNGNEIAIDRATPKEKTALLPGRLSMSQPNLQLPGGSSHGTSHYGIMRGVNSAASPPSLNSGLLLSSVCGRQMSHPALPLSMLSSQPAGQHSLQANGSTHSGAGGSYHGGSYHSGSYHGGTGSYHGGSYHGGLSSSGSFHGGQSGAGSYHGGQSAAGAGSFHGAQHFGGGGAGDAAAFQGHQAASAYGGSGLGSMGGYGSASGVSISLLQAAALQQQLNAGGGALGGLEGGSPSQLISLLSANAAGAGSTATPLARYAAAGQAAGSAASSQNDLGGLLGQQVAQESSVHGGWLRGTLPGSGSMGGSGGGGGSLGPASARAGPRIFIGKLSKDTSEQDVKDHFMRFGFVLDVYLPRDKNNKREHRGFGFVTFETEAAIQRVVAHGPHHIRGSIVAIDSAVPRQEEVVLAIDGHTGLAAGTGLGADRETVEAIHAMEVLSLEGSGRGRALLRPTLSGAGLGVGQPY